MNFKLTEIGELPFEWEVDTMENALNEIIDYRGKTPVKSETGIVTLSAKSVKDGYIDYSKAYFISESTYQKFMVRGFPRKGDILLTTEAPLGLVARLDREKVGIAQRLLTLRGKKEYLLNDYLMYYLMSNEGKHQLTSRQSGTTVTGIKQKEFRKCLISIPPFEEQKAIAHLLSTIDEKIEVNNQINKILENIAQEIFKKWFVDFEFPNEEGEPYKSSGGEMFESELGMIPKGWEVSSLYDIADYINGTSFKKNEVNEFEGIPIIKIVEIKNGYSKSTSFYNGTTNKAKKYYLRKRDILFSWSGNPETSIDIFIWSKEQGILNQHIFKVEPYDYSKSYIYFLLKNFKSVFMDIASNKQTTGLGHVTVADLKRLRTPIPNEEILSEFIKISDVIIDFIFLKTTLMSYFILLPVV